MKRGLWKQCVAEAVGTFILVFCGVGAVHTAVLTGAQLGLWQVATVWGVAVALAIYATGVVSGAHLNPAITVALAAWRGFPWSRVAPYVGAQLAGAVAAAGALYALFHNTIVHFETARHLVRGRAGSELSAMVYGEYFPNPAMVAGGSMAPEAVTLVQAMVAEAAGTALLAFVIFVASDERGSRRPSRTLPPILIGLGLALAITIVAPLTQAGLNPARDFGPRLFAFFAGWGPIAIPGPRGGFLTVYILAPIVGAVLGGAIYEKLVRPALPQPEEYTPEPGVTHERVLA